MKRFLLIFIVLMCFVSSAIFAQITLDVKTKFKEKYQLKGVKYGVIYFLKQKGYKVVEVGEDYALWLTDIQEKRIEPDRYSIRLYIKISRPSLFRQKKAIASELIEMDYSYMPKMLNIDDTGFLRFIKEKVQSIKVKEMLRAFQVGIKVANRVKYMLKGINGSPKI
jgi:hypothetical protein